MDVSQSISRGVRGRERRSGSRTSIGSRGKSLRLTTEQKTVIAHKEIERWEHRLSNFRLFAKQVKRDGLAEIEERALKLGETEKTREMLIKGMAGTIIIIDDKKTRDRKKVISKDAPFSHTLRSLRSMFVFLRCIGFACFRGRDFELPQAV